MNAPTRHILHPAAVGREGFVSITENRLNNGSCLLTVMGWDDGYSLPLTRDERRQLALLLCPELSPDLCDCCDATAMNCKCQGDWNEDRSICAYHSERRRIAREARHIAGGVIGVD